MAHCCYVLFSPIVALLNRRGGARASSKLLAALIRAWVPERGATWTYCNWRNYDYNFKQWVSFVWALRCSKNHKTWHTGELWQKFTYFSGFANGQGKMAELQLRGPLSHTCMKFGRHIYHTQIYKTISWTEVSQFELKGLFWRFTPCVFFTRWAQGCKGPFNAACSFNLNCSFLKHYGCFHTKAVWSTLNEPWFISSDSRAHFGWAGILLCLGSPVSPELRIVLMASY